MGLGPDGVQRRQHVPVVNTNMKLHNRLLLPPLYSQLVFSIRNFAVVFLAFWIGLG